MTTLRHNWTEEEIRELWDTPLLELIYQAQTIHRQVFDPRKIQTSTLISIKTGGCPENCAYCPQSAHYKNDQREPFFSVETVVEEAKQAKTQGASRFCMGAAWRQPSKKDFPQVLEMIKQVKLLGLETCVTLGMVNEEQAHDLKESGLDYYNHNLDTSRRYYREIITTRTYEDRLNTLEQIRKAGVKVCCGGIVGMGETQEDRISFLKELATLPEHPQSVPINGLSPAPGTPLENTPPLDSFDFIRTIAVARILMPKSFVRLSAGRTAMTESTQALCFMAGANSIFYGDREKLFLTPNPGTTQDKSLFEKLGLELLSYEDLQNFTPLS